MKSHLRQQCAHLLVGRRLDWPWLAEVRIQRLLDQVVLALAKRASGPKRVSLRHQPSVLWCRRRTETEEILSSATAACLAVTEGKSGGHRKIPRAAALLLSGKTNRGSGLLPVRYSRHNEKTHLVVLFSQECALLPKVGIISPCRERWATFVIVARLSLLSPDLRM